MGQGYIDNDTAERFNILFEGENQVDVEKQMEDLKNRLLGSATLEFEATGETSESVRDQLKRQLLDK